jgi:hypothetical protein
METAAVQAVQPFTCAYEHHQACQRVVARVYIFDATREETEAAREAVRKALTMLPIGADPMQLDRAEEAAVAPYKAAVAARKERARLESEKQAERRAMGWKADNYLGHIAKYLEEEEFKGRYWEMLRERDRLRPLIREALIDELMEDPDMSDDEIRESIEDQIDEGV